MTKDEWVRDILLELRSDRVAGWPWLRDTDGRRATKRQANKFMLGAIMDYQMDASIVWDNAETLSEELLGDPGDLWGVIASMPQGELARLFRGPPALHRFVKRMPKRVQRIAKDVVRRYGGDARKVWEGQPPDEIVRRLEDMGVGRQISKMIRGALVDTGQAGGKGDLKADSNVRRVLGRVFEGDTVSEDGALKIADRLVPDDSWKLDGPLYNIGKEFCITVEPLCSECPLRKKCLYGQ